MKRVLHLPYNLGLSGLETVIMNWYRNIDRTKIQFDFAIPENARLDFKEEIEQLGGKIFLLPNNKTFLGKFKFYYALYKLIKREGPFECFHTHAHYSAGRDCFIAFLAGITKRFVISHFSEGHGYLKISIPKRFISKLLIHLFATKRFSVSKDAGKNLYGSSTFLQVNNGIDTNRFSYTRFLRNKVRKKLGIENSFVIGHIGRFAEQKNHSFLINVFAELTQKEKNAILLLAGWGPLESEIKRKVIQAGLENKVKFLGLIKNTENLYNAFDVFIFPSFFEGLGIVAIEAQCAGLPCFISDGVPDDAMICNTIKIPLAKPAKEWAEIILDKTKGFQRENCSLKIKNAGFDIKDTAKLIEQEYLQ